ALPLVLAFASGMVGLILLDRSPPMPGGWDPAVLPLYIAAGRSAVSPFALMRDKRHFWASDRSSFLAYACRVGVALALGPAVGPAGGPGRRPTPGWRGFRRGGRGARRPPAPPPGPRRAPPRAGGAPPHHDRQRSTRRRRRLRAQRQGDGEPPPPGDEGAAPGC